MSETVYIKTDKNIEVSKRMVLIGDVADVYCSDKKMENDIKHICLIILDEVGVNKIKKKRVCLSFMDIVKAVAKKYPDADVNNLAICLMKMILLWITFWKRNIQSFCRDY